MLCVVKMYFTQLVLFLTVYCRTEMIWEMLHVLTHIQFFGVFELSKCVWLGWDGLLTVPL